MINEFFDIESLSDVVEILVKVNAELYEGYVSSVYSSLWIN